MTSVFVVVALFFAALAAAIVYFLGKGAEAPSRGRVRVLGAIFAILSAIAVVAWQYAMVYYRMPAWVIAALVVLWVVVVGVAVLIVRARGFSIQLVLTIGGLLLVSAAAITFVMMFSPLGAPTPLFSVRAAQIAEANGFTALLPAGEEMIADYLPVDTTPDGKGLAVEYERFLLHERAAGRELTEEDLLSIVEMGNAPCGWAVVPESAVIEVLTIKGRPALGVTFDYLPEQAQGKAAARSSVSILVCGVGTTDVRIESASGWRYVGPGEVYEPFDELTVDELVAIAEKLEPID